MIPGVDFIGVGMGAVIVNQEGKIFLAKRGKEARNNEGKWEFPGGGVKLRETLEDAIKREIKEEFGINIEPLEIFIVSDNIIESEQHWVVIGYISKFLEGEPKIFEPHKCTEIGWFALDEIENLDLTELDRVWLNELKEKHLDKLINLSNI